MSVDTETVRRIARLSRLALKDEELAPMAQELNGILNWVEQLKEVDTAGVEPMTGGVHTALKRRADVVNDGHIQQDVLRNAPSAGHGFYVVPKVVE